MLMIRGEGKFLAHETKETAEPNCKKVKGDRTKGTELASDRQRFFIPFYQKGR
jgi:hypothetical protein